MFAEIQALRAMALEDARRFRKEKTRAVALYAVAGVLGITAYTCAVAALVLWIAQNSSPVLGAGVAALGFAALALVVIAVVGAMNRAEKRRREARAQIYAATVRSAASSAAAEVLMRPQTLAAGAAVLIAGLALGVLKGRGSTEDPDDLEPPGPM
jgi:uncharacterized membrane protein